MEPIELHYTIPYFGRFVISNREVPGFDPAKPYLLKFKGKVIGRFIYLEDTKKAIRNILYEQLWINYNTYINQQSILVNINLEEPIE